MLQNAGGGRNEADVYSATGSTFSIAANRISYCFDLRGPSMAMDTACSSALTACHVACQSLWRGDCKMAIVAGVNAILKQDNYVAFSRMSMLSPDGRCKAFDASANGFVRGEGVGAIILKPLSAAQADGDKIYALIRSTGANQDGRTNGITVPSRHAQERLIRQTCRDADISPGEISYVEAHGTGTALGDPVEIATGSSPKRGPQGAKITITRHGVPAAMLVPVEETGSKLTHQEVVEGMRALRKRVKPDSMSVREMVNEGRRF